MYRKEDGCWSTADVAHIENQAKSRVGVNEKLEYWETGKQKPVLEENEHSNQATPKAREGSSGEQLTQLTPTQTSLCHPNWLQTRSVHQRRECEQVINHLHLHVFNLKTTFRFSPNLKLLTEM